METIQIYGDYIQLDQMMKKLDLISSGGETGPFLASHQVSLNGQKVHEKRKKIRPEDTLIIDGKIYEIKSA